jgi:hypothetical protein
MGARLSMLQAHADRRWGATMACCRQAADLLERMGAEGNQHIGSAVTVGDRLTMGQVLCGVWFSD